MDLSREDIVIEIRGAKKGIKQCKAGIKRVLEGVELKAYKTGLAVQKFVLKAFEDALIHIDERKK